MKKSLVVFAALGSLFLAQLAEAAGVAVRVNRAHPVGKSIEFAANGVGTGDLSFTWDFGDGTKSEPSAEGIVSHTFTEPGHYPVIVVVTDDTGSRSDSFIQTVHQPLPAHASVSSSTIAYDSLLKRVCNVNADNDTISCLSTESLELLFEVPVGRHPRSLAFAPDGNLWVTNQDDATVSVLDTEGATVAEIELPHSSMPFGIVMSPLRGSAYVTLQALGEVAELDINARTLSRRAPAVPWATGISLDPTGSRIFVTRLISSAEAGSVVEINAESLEMDQNFVLAMDPGPDTEASARGVPNYLRAAVPSPDGSTLWVPSKKDNVLRGTARDGEALTFETSVRTIVSIVDLSANEELLERRADLNNRALGLSLTFSRLGDYAFVGLMGNNGLEVLDAYNGKIVAGAFNLGRAPDGLVIDDLGQLFVHSFLSRSIVVLDASTVLASTNFNMNLIKEIVVSTQEKLSPEVLQGKQIFYDASDLRMSLDGYISCASCHLDGFEDGQVWDFTDRGEGLRNTTSLFGRRGAEQGRLHWSGNFDEVQDFEHDMRGPFGGKGFLPDDVFNGGTLNTTLGDVKAGLSPELDALAAYVSSLDRVSPSPFRDPDGSLTESGWRGLEIFQTAGCADCHSGADFTDSAEGGAHDVGTIVESSGQRLGGALEGIDTPTLRGIWQTAPYFHDGSAATLAEVIGSRNLADLHGTTSNLDAAEISDLESYLLQIDNVALEDEAALEPPEPVEDPEPELPAGENKSDDGGCSFRSGVSPSTPTSPLAISCLILVLAIRRQRRLS